MLCGPTVWFSSFECVFVDAHRVQMGAPAGLQEQTHHAHCIWSQGQCSSSWDHFPCYLQVRKKSPSKGQKNAFFFLLLYSPSFSILLTGTTVRSLWVTDVGESSAGLSVTSRVVRQPTTGWRTRWWTAAQAARFVSPSPSGATTAGTVGSSSVKSKPRPFNLLALPQNGQHFTCLVEWPHTVRALLYRCSRFQSEIKRLKISSPVRVCQNCYYNLQHELGAEGRNWAPPTPLEERRTRPHLLGSILRSSHMSGNHMYTIRLSRPA